MSNVKRVKGEVMEVARMPLWLEPEDFEDYAEGLREAEDGELCPRCHLFAGRPQSGRFLSGHYTCTECGHGFEVQDA